MTSREFIAASLALVVYMGIIFYLSSLPGDLLHPEREFGFNFDEAIEHFAEFSILGILTAYIFWQLTREIRFERGVATFISASAFSALYGVTDEIHQYFVPTRWCTFPDVLTDITGGITGVLIFLICARLYVEPHKIEHIS